MSSRQRCSAIVGRERVSVGSESESDLGNHQPCHFRILAVFVPGRSRKAGMIIGIPEIVRSESMEEMNGGSR